MRERTWPAAVVFCFFGAVGIGLGVAVVVAVVFGAILSRSCTPDEDCLGVAGGISFGLLAGIAVAALAVIVLSALQRVLVFGVGVAVSLLLFTSSVLLYLDNVPLYAGLSLTVFIGCTVLSRYLRSRTTELS